MVEKIVRDSANAGTYDVLNVSLPVALGTVPVDKDARAMRFFYKNGQDEYRFIVGCNEGQTSASVTVEPNATDGVIIKVSEGFLYFIGGRWPISGGRRISLATPNLDQKRRSAPPTPELAFVPDPGASALDRVILIVPPAKTVEIKCDNSPLKGFSKTPAYFEADDKCEWSSEIDLPTTSNVGVGAKYGFMKKIVDAAR